MALLTNTHAPFWATHSSIKPPLPPAAISRVRYPVKSWRRQEKFPFPSLVDGQRALQGSNKVRAAEGVGERRQTDGVCPPARPRQGLRRSQHGESTGLTKSPQRFCAFLVNRFPWGLLTRQAVSLQLMTTIRKPYMKRSSALHKFTIFSSLFLPGNTGHVAPTADALLPALSFRRRPTAVWYKSKQTDSFAAELSESSDLETTLA